MKLDSDGVKSSMTRNADHCAASSPATRQASAPSSSSSCSRAENAAPPTSALVGARSVDAAGIAGATCASIGGGTAPAPRRLAAPTAAGRAGRGVAGRRIRCSRGSRAASSFASEAVRRDVLRAAQQGRAARRRHAPRGRAALLLQELRRRRASSRVQRPRGAVDLARDVARPAEGRERPRSRTKACARGRASSRSLRASGIAHPRIAVCGLNPHTGDGGSSAARRSTSSRRRSSGPRAQAIDARRPFPADTIFVARAGGRLRRGRHDVPRPGPDRDEADGLRSRRHGAWRPADPVATRPTARRTTSPGKTSPASRGCSRRSSWRCALPRRPAPRADAAAPAAHRIPRRRQQAARVARGPRPRPGAEVRWRDVQDRSRRDPPPGGTLARPARRRSRRDARVARSARSGRAARGKERGLFLLGCSRSRRRSSASSRTCRRTRPTATRSRSASRRRIPATSRSRSASPAIMRWNALAMVVRANQAYGELGGHIASYASAAEIFEVGFNHFFRAPTTGTAATSCSSSRTRRPASMRARFSRAASTEEQLANYRQEVGGGGLSSYPHPWLMPDFWQFPTGSMGIGPISAIYQARFMRYLEHRGIADTRRPARVGRVRRRRDGRARVDRRAHARRAREARQPHVRRQLQPAAPRRPGARQRPDHPGARGAVHRRRLERDQGAVGLRLGPAVRARHEPRAAAPLRRDGRRRVPDARRQRRRLQPRALLRPRSGAAGARRAHDAGRDRRATPRRPRLPQAPRRASRARAHRGQPTVILAKTKKGYGMGERGRVAHDRRTSRRSSTSTRCRRFRDRFALPLDRRRSRASCASTARPRTAPRSRTCARAARRSAALCRARRRAAPPLAVPPLEQLSRQFALERRTARRCRPRWRSCACSARC